MSLDTLKRSNSLDKLLNAVKEDNAPQEKKSYIDERLWKPELDKSGNGYSVIRFIILYYFTTLSIKLFN